MFSASQARLSETDVGGPHRLHPNLRSEFYIELRQQLESTGDVVGVWKNSDDSGLPAFSTESAHSGQWPELA
jgi:hypothetical protein